MKSRLKLSACLLMIGCCQLLLAQAPALPIKSGDKIVFMGDSITAEGGVPSGYCQLVIMGLATNGVQVTLAGVAGVSGNKSNQMLERLQKDVLDRKPDWMTLSCGVNDVYHGGNGIPLEQYKQNITAIVDHCQAAGVKVMILTATMIHEDPDDPYNQELAGYNDFLRELAKEKKCLLADLNAEMQAAVKRIGAPKTFHALTRDGLHMNPLGNQVMAIGVLKEFGLSEEQIQKVKEAWLNIPCGVNAQARVTVRQFQQLNDMALHQNRSLDDLIGEQLTKAAEKLLETK